MSGKSDGSSYDTDVTADPSKFVAGMNAAKTAAATASEQINAQFKKIGDTVTQLNKYLLGFTAVLAGGGALKKFISDANEWNGTAGLMAARLGVSTEKASVLETALTRLGIESDVYMTAAEKLSKQVHTNSAAFDTLGVSVKDASGQYRPVTDLMGEVNQKLLDIKNPIEQNIAGQQVYGKGWSEVRGILKLTAAQMKDSEARARELGLIVGPEGVAMSKQYSAQMRDLNLVGKSLELQFGQQLLPVFTTVGEFMGTEAPALGQVFGTVLKGIAFAAGAVWLTLKDMGDSIGALAAQAMALASGDLAAFKAIGKERDAQLAANEAKFEKMKAMFASGGAAAKLPADPNVSRGPTYDFAKEGSTKDTSRTGQWEADLEARKASLAKQGLAEDQYREMSKSAELAYWNEIKGRGDLTQAERLAVSRKVSETELSLAKQTLDGKVAALETEAAAYKNNTDERLRIETEIQSRYQEGTAQYEASEKRITEIKRQAAEQRKQIDELAQQAARDHQVAAIAMEEQQAQAQAQMGIITHEQLLAQEAQYEDRRYELAKDALTKRLQLAERDPDRNPAELARIHNELEALDDAHNQRMTGLQLQAAADFRRPWLDAFQSIQSGITNGLVNAMQGLMNHTMTLRQAMASVWKSITSAVIGEIIKMTAAKIAAWAVDKALAIAGIGTDAAKAGAGAASSVANIPYVGPILAVAAMATVFAAVSGLSSKVPSASAAGGYDIPAFANPVVQTHAREMILPAKHADVIRDMADNGGGDGGGGGDLHLHGAPLRGGFWILHQDDMIDSYKRAQRSGKI
jgi:hypothetical protein